MQDFTKIYLGKLTEDELRNVVREVRALWLYADNIWPNGDKKQRPQLKATRDPRGDYSIWLNPRALTYLVLKCKDIPAIVLNNSAGTDAPMPPDFLQYDH